MITYRFAKLPLALVVMTILWATPAAAAYVMFVGGAIISVKGQEIVLRVDGQPDIENDLRGIIKVHLKGDEKIWIGSRLNPSYLRSGEWVIVRSLTDKTGRLSLSDEAHPLHAENIEIPKYRSSSRTAAGGSARRMSEHISPGALDIDGPIRSVTKTSLNYLLTIHTHINCTGCVQFVEVDSATSILTYTPGDITSLRPGLEISLAPLSKGNEDDDFWVSRTLLVGNGIIKFKNIGPYRPWRLMRRPILASIRRRQRRKRRTIRPCKTPSLQPGIIRR